jgi:glutamate transport system permease protein
VDVVTSHLDLFWAGYQTSVAICVCALVASLSLGLLLATMRVSPIPPLQTLGASYVTLLQNVPLSVVLYFVAFGVPELGIHASYFVFGVGGLSLYTAAFVCEAIRSGVNSVAVGQGEAARSIGMSSTQSLMIVIVPQAIRATVPPLSNTLLSMITNSAVVGAFGVGGDLFAASQTLTASQGYPYLPVLTGVAVGYLAITIPAAFGLRVLERRMAILR